MIIKVAVGSDSVMFEDQRIEAEPEMSSPNALSIISRRAMDWRHHAEIQADLLH